MKLKELRKEFGKTQTDIANYLNVSQNCYWSYEAGKNEPDIKTLIKLSNYYNVSIDYLVSNENKNIVQVYNEDEKTLLNNYAMLNNVNKLKVNAYILGMLASQ